MIKIVEIRGHGGLIRLEVYNYERPNAADEDDQNWLSAKCSVTVREFTCALSLSLVTHDFVRFTGQLEEAVQQLSGTASFTTPEEGLEVEIKFKAAGKADVFGRARSWISHVPDQSVLSFSFETDQSFLTRTVRELKEIVSKFPVRKG